MRISSNRVALNVRTMEPMVRAAESLGYRLDALSGGQAPMELAVRFSLTRSSGDILVMERGESGRLVVSTNGSREIIQQVVREHVLTRAKAHLQARGMEVRARQLPTGEILLEGRERTSSQPGGQASVTAEVGREGTMRIDVGGIKGQRCEEIVNGLARAVEGECVDARRKAEFFQLPAPTEERLRV